jgi:hypothetical protein
MAYSKSPLVFVYLGDTLPEYVYYSLLLACETSHCDVIFISEVAVVLEDKNNYQNVLLDTFYDKFEFENIVQNLNFDENLWDGFWLKTLERFFVIKQWMKYSNTDKLFHAELDNLVFNLTDLDKKLDNLGAYIFVPRDSDERVIASLVYINSYESITKFCKYAGKENESKNEMELLSHFADENPNYIKSLPTDIIFENIEQDKEIKEYQQLNGIFDAASLGQWLFGIDARLIKKPLFNHFKNDCAYSKIEKLKFNYDKEFHTFSVNIENKIYNLYNLHVHSKVHKKIYNRLFLDNVIENSNKGKESLIDKNLLNSCKGIYSYLRTILGVNQ